MSESKPLVVGVGNLYRHDDGVGVAVIERLRQQLAEDVDVAEEGGEPAALVERWTGRSLVMLVDAAVSGAAPGTVRRVETVAGTSPGPGLRSAASSHGLGVAEAIALGRALDRLPGRLVVFAVEAADLSEGTGLSADVAAAVGRVVDGIRIELRTIAGVPC